MADNSALVAARPQFRLAGQEEADLASALVAFDLRDDTQGLARAEIEFGNWGTKDNGLGFLFFDRALLDFGKDLQVRLGDATLFDGRIMALQGVFPEGAPPRLKVLADDRLQDLRMTRRSRSFADMSDSDVLRQVAGDHGLTPQIDVSGPTHKHLAQVNQSDLAFLRERARAIDAELWVEGRTLHAKKRASRDAGSVQLGWGNLLRSFEVTADLAGQRTAVTVSGWDVAGKQGIKAEATSSAISGELGGDESGISILEAKVGARKENIAHPVPVTESEARAAAEAVLRMAARRFVTAHGVADASAGLRVGTHVELAELGPLFSGKYTVTSVRHRFDGRQGLRSEFTAERPGIGR